MSTDYSKMSDFDINLRVAEIVVDYDCISRVPYTEMAVYWGDGANWHVFNPCNNPEDAWPIIIENEISLISRCANGEWKAQLHLGREDIFDSYASCWDKNPLRAAMIVFLMMQESQNAS